MVFQDAMAEAKLLEHNHSQLSSPTTQHPLSPSTHHPTSASSTAGTTTLIFHGLPAVNEEDRETSSA